MNIIRNNKVVKEASGIKVSFREATKGFRKFKLKIF